MSIGVSSAFNHDLRALVNCHSTPGDEDEVATLLLSRWKESGWVPRAHGRYAVSATQTPYSEALPTLLVCAHMDSPGFSVESFKADRCRVVPLGHPVFAPPSAECVLKSGADRHWVVVESEERESGSPQYWIPRHPQTRFGDRLCYHGIAEIGGDGTIASPFLDNRLGCAILTELARLIGPDRQGMNIVLGATSGEEMGSGGAPVLARAVRPDLVVCMDATYEDVAQNVVIGNGPVLTLSDASVLLGDLARNRALAFATSVGITLQTEVYNCSGTDSRAFPAVGLSAPVAPLLLPTSGNHSPVERGHCDDVEALLKLLVALRQPEASAAFFATPFGCG